MSNSQYINGFSKLSNSEKISIIVSRTNIAIEQFNVLNQFKLQNTEIQKQLDEISENVVSNYMLPFSIAPNFMVNGKAYFVPMVIEESSVVAAASAAAKFWFNRGGFVAKVISTIKIGQVHFNWLGNSKQLKSEFENIKERLIASSSHLLENMRRRNGGIVDIELIDFTNKLENYYQVRVKFETADAMGANIINSVLEEMAQALKQYFFEHFSDAESEYDIVMAILSNHTPESIVECYVECDIDDLAEISGELSPMEYAQKFKLAVDIANIDIYRATTHNKGIYNGVDAVVLATGNDFRAVEACGHSYAARNGHYKSLTTVDIDKGKFRYALRIPMALGTVGGLTNLHPLAKLSLDILGKPSAKELMAIVAAAGLANTFSAVRALTTSGIQKGHMRFHLNNILSSLNATNEQKERAEEYFKNRKVSHKSVQEFLGS
ncbi:MAG: hydroxymethylglutaryl-CoA reductase, degradative [Bacteroidales bacterium]|nr:hydroxymethylglutaryl-CoA reductase, degradative [Bacteroidales bacterium]MDD3893230.1 hydroxymethylglutaryl-CoA reductase, degradative [Bacteroidales bacterium]